MNAILAAAIIFVVFAVGDMVSAKTKAIVSMLLVALPRPCATCVTASPVR